MEDSESLRNQIDRLEGSLKDLQDKNANYADMTLVLADASQQMDNDRFVDSIIPPEKTPDGQPNLEVSPTEENPELDMYGEDDVDDVTVPYLGRFADITPIVKERESQIDLRDFNELKAPQDLTDDYTRPSFLKGLGSDRSDDYDFDTPQQDQGVDSCPLETQFARSYSEDYCDQNFRARARSKTQEQLPDRPENRSSRTTSQVVEPVNVRGFDESLYYDDPMRVYPNQSADYKRRVEIQHYRNDIVSELSPIEDIETIGNDLPQMEDDYDVDNAISTLEENDVINSASNMRVRRDSKHPGYSGEGNDSDSDIDNFISQHQQSFAQPNQEEVRPNSPYFPRPVSKSSLGCYQTANKPASPKNVILRNKEAPREPHKRLTLPPQAMGSYEEYGPRTPGPYMSKSSAFNTPQPNLKFRPVQSARDVPQYDTVFSRRRKNTIDSSIELEPEIEYRPAVADKTVLRHNNSQRSFNRNKSTDHRKYVAYSRTETISPTSPPQETSFEDQDGYDIIVNSSEITNMRQPTEYRYQQQYSSRNSAYSGYNAQHRQPTRPRNEYAVPAPVGVARNHGYIPNNDNTSPVQSLDSGIDSLFNDHRPRTAAAQTVYYRNEYEDYDERPRESLKEMENMVSELRNELKVLTTKVNLFESKGIDPNSDPTSPIAQSHGMLPTGLPGPSLPLQPRAVSPTGNKYSAYTPTHLRNTPVASNNNEGARIRQDPRYYEARSPVTSVSPVQSYHPNPISKYSQPRKGYSTEYDPPAREPMYQPNLIKSNLKKPVYSQTSSPNMRPKSVSKITSNTVHSTTRALTHPTRPSGMDATPKYISANRMYTPTIPRAQSSTGTSGARLQPSRYTASPSQINRAISPQPITSARKPNPSRPIHSSNSYRITEGYYHEEGPLNQQTYIPKPNQRHH